MRNIALRFGLIAAGINVLGWVILQSLIPKKGEIPDFAAGEILGYTAMLLSFTMIFIGIRHYRNKIRGGYINFGQAFVMGLYITLVASIVYVVGWMIYYPTFMPDFTDQYLAYQVQSLEEAGKTAIEIEQETAVLEEQMELYKHPVIMSAMSFMEIFPLGLILSLIAAALMKRKQPETTS